MKRKKRKLKRISFDYHIWKSFIAFLNKEEKSANKKNGKGSSDDFEFRWMDSSNRNPEQVPDGLWRRLLHKHLKDFNHN